MRHVLNLVLFAVVASAGCMEDAPDVRRNQKVIDEIEKLGGKVKLDAKAPGKRIIGINLQFKDVTDDNLFRFKSLTDLRELHLDGSRITDKGLEHIKGLARLRDLCIPGTQITDDGLHYIAQLEGLEILDLHNTKVSANALSKKYQGHG